MIRKGVILPDSAPVGMGVNSARRGIVDLGTEQADVIYKKLPEPELAAELFCAVLARTLNLPAPEPFLLFDPTDGQYAFGSADLEYPNSFRKFNIVPGVGPNAAVAEFLEALTGWDRAKDVTAFDEWINNRDRNLGNILFAGPGDFAIIDHGKALNVDPDYIDQNLLCSMLQAACSTDRARTALLRSLVRIASSFDMLDTEPSYADLSATGIEGHAASAEQFQVFLEQRLVNIVALLNNRFLGQQSLLVSDNEHS